MKQLQNNFTTPEQSKRLLELGVPEDSADMMYYPEFTENLYSIGNGGFRMSDTPRVLRAYDKFSNSTCYDSDKFRELCAPCWSVGRLIEICLKCSTLEQRQVRFFCNGDDDEYSLIDYVITALESGVMTNHMDFSKLED